jgi:hypothetical protein
MWIDDDELIDKLGSLTACIVVTKQGRDQRKLDKLQRLRELNERTAGVPIRAFPGLGGWPRRWTASPRLSGRTRSSMTPCCRPFARLVIAAMSAVTFQSSMPSEFGALTIASASAIGDVAADELHLRCSHAGDTQLG